MKSSNFLRKGVHAIYARMQTENSNCGRRSQPTPWDALGHHNLTCRSWLCRRFNTHRELMTNSADILKSFIEGSLRAVAWLPEPISVLPLGRDGTPNVLRLSASGPDALAGLYEWLLDRATGLSLVTFWTIVRAALLLTVPAIICGTVFAHYHQRIASRSLMALQWTICSVCIFATPANSTGHPRRCLPLSRVGCFSFTSGTGRSPVAAGLVSLPA